MRYIKLRDLEVSRIGLGAMGMSHGYIGSGTDDPESIRTVHRALELGVTLIDTAEIYGPYTNEELLGRALKGHREKVVLAERGEEGIARIRELTGGVDKVIEAVGTRQALDTALGAVLDGGTISRLGVPQYEQGPIGPAEFMHNITLTGGASPARAYIPELLPDVLDGTITPGRVFDRTFTLDQTPDAYQAMADRQVLEALIRP
ncbi:aldo/keto reductase (plasmid) [Streptomyces sp. NBC_00012]|uniref:aldo/keto reductase n=1 Tax=Streptomyces sp. NBC_00012 TaxID=2975621 RepID=UPI002F9080D6